MQVWLERRTEELKASDVVNQVLARLEQKSPKVSKRKYPKVKRDGLLLEIMIPDLHIGRYTVTEESGENYGIRLAERVVMTAVESILAKTGNARIERILMPFGHDFFNVDNEKNTTAKGTPQQEEARWMQSFLAGERILEMIVTRLIEVAPLELYFIPGNHDPHRLFYLGEFARAFYRNNRNVKVTNSTRTRQYYQWGGNLFGFAHGDETKVDQLVKLMPYEEPQMFANTRYREWHLGHFHTKKDMEFIAYDDIGMTLRFFRSLTSADAWHFDNGFVGSPKAAEGLLWTAGDGLYAQLPATIKQEVYIQ